MIENYSRQIKDALNKKRIKIGDRIRIEKSGQVYEGLLMPRIETGDPNSLVIKLDNGYNIGISFGKNVKIKKLRLKEKIKKPKAFKIKFDPSKPSISILATGGTVASRIDYRTGAVIPITEPEELLSAIPELGEIANISTRTIFSMFSEDMEPEHWVILAQKIADEIRDIQPDGIIVMHGTDTMHYTSAALAFMLQNLPIPIILVGSQRSSDRGSSDAAMNLICAAHFIAKSDFSGVAVCMHGSMDDEYCLIHQATRVKKMHTSRRDAFKSIDVLPYAKVHVDGQIEFLRNDYPKRDKTRELKLDAVFDKRVAIIKVRPGLSYKELEFYRSFRGLVIEGTGLGHAPVSAFDEYTKDHEKILKTLKKMSKDMIILMTSQCPYGRVNMNVYSTGRDLQKSGVIPCYMTTETAYVKLGWALGHTKDLNEAKELIKNNVAGEIVRSDPRGFL